MGILLFIGTSYAIWQLILPQKTTNIITTDCFKITLTDQNPINMGKSYPITDEEGSSLTPYEFTIENTCNSNASYQINLEVLEDSTLDNLDYMKVMLDEKIKLLTTNQETPKTLDNATKSYKLQTGYLRENQSKTFHLRLWLDENTPASEVFMNKTFFSKVTINTSHIIDETSPEVVIKATQALNSITVDASESFDENTGINMYYFRLKDSDWNESKEPHFTFSNLEYQEYTIEVQIEDKVGNKSEIKSIKKYPKVKATAYINSLNGNKEVLNDDTKEHNIRYVGKSPKNYIDIGDRDANGNIILWRIIGVMNNIKSSTNSVGETRLKIIRAESIGDYSWDSSPSNVNGGNGINEWSEADINTLLNDYYYNRKANQKCFNAENNSAIDCDFSRHGLSEKSKNYIGDAIWHLGSNGSQAAFNGINTSNFYLMERSSTSGKICPTATYCNDGLKREATWTGIIGLMYPSDYGYATSGGSATNRLTCLNNVLYNWYTTNIKDCKNNNWLEKENKEQWTIMPLAYSSNASSVFYMDSSKAGSNYLASYSRAINPTLYLLPNVFFTNGIGEVSNPFVVSIE